MQDHDFEKQVHKKMEEMKLLPSEAVWARVEMRLQRKERRRYWILWLPLILTGLSLGGYLSWDVLHTPSEKLLHSVARRPAVEQLNNNPNAGSAKEQTTGKTGNGLIKENTEKTIRPAAQKDNLSNIRINQQKDNDPVKVPADQPLNEKINHFSTTDPGYSLISGKPGNKESALVISDSVVDQAQKDVQPTADQPERAGTSSDIKDPAFNIPQEAEKELFPVAVKTYPVSSKPVNTSLLLARNNLMAKIDVKHRGLDKGWQWGISFQGGRSSLSNGTLNKLFASNSPSYFLSANPGTGQPSAIYKEPSPTKASAGFSAGVFLKRQMSRRVAVSIGLNYTLYSTTTKVGNKADSSGNLSSASNGNQIAFNQFYRLGNTGSYTSKYHLIELPVMLQTSLTRHWNMPLYWDFGFSLSKFIAGNTLHFDNVSGIYYKDDVRFNKTQFNIFTGFPVGVFSAKSLALQAGPAFQYGITRMPAGEANTGKHFLFLGLKANLLIGKK